MTGCDLSTSVGRITYLAALRSAKRYLEIGVQSGNAFLRIHLPVKVGVDPAFAFDTAAHGGDGIYYHALAPNVFFHRLKKNEIDTGVAPGKSAAFDIMFIDGLHTFAQSYRDFVSSLDFAHDDTVWILDDTVPCDAYSAIPDHKSSHRLRAEAELEGTPWHGDVYKTVLAIHDFHPEYSYCTLMGGNPQTVVWKAPTNGRKKAFASLEAINGVRFGDLVRNNELLMPVDDDQIADLLGKSLSPRALINPQNNSLSNRLRDKAGQPLSL